MFKVKIHESLLSLNSCFSCTISAIDTHIVAECSFRKGIAFACQGHNQQSAIELKTGINRVFGGHMILLTPHNFLCSCACPHSPEQFFWNSYNLSSSEVIVHTLETYMTLVVVKNILSFQSLVLSMVIKK